MPQLTVLSQAGKTVEKLALADDVFGIEPHKQAIFDVVQAQRAAMRQGTSKTKTALKYQVVVENHGNKKELDVRVQDPFVLHNGVVVESSLDRIQEVTLLNLTKK